MKSFQPTGVILIPGEEELKSVVDKAGELMKDFTPAKAMDALKVISSAFCFSHMVTSQYILMLIL